MFEQRTRPEQRAVSIHGNRGPSWALLLVFALALLHLTTAAQGKTIICTNNGNAQTPPMRGPAGTVVVVTVHTEDDHGKNTHLCDTTYALQLQQAGSSPARVHIFDSDGPWDRLLVFRVDGFSTDGGHAFLFFSEGAARSSEITVVDYDVLARTSTTASLKPPRNLRPACIATLHIAGKVPSSQMVIATAVSAGCDRTQQWIARADSPNSTSIARFPERLAPTMQVMPISPGTRP